MIAKYFATSLAIEKVVNAPRVISSCLPIATISMSFVGSLSRSTMLPASRAAIVPVFIATPTSDCASAGASLVPSPHIATSLPLACSSRISFSLSSGVAWARKSSTPDSEALADTALDDVLEVDYAQQPVVLGNRERGAALSGDSLGNHGDLPDRVRHGCGAQRRLGASGSTAPQRPGGPAFGKRNDRIDRSLTDRGPFDIDAAHPGLRRERDKAGIERCHLAPAQPVFLLGQNHDRAALRGFVGKRGE